MILVDEAYARISWMAPEYRRARAPATGAERDRRADFPRRSSGWPACASAMPSPLPRSSRRSTGGPRGTSVNAAVLSAGPSRASRDPQLVPRRRKRTQRHPAVAVRRARPRRTTVHPVPHELRHDRRPRGRGAGGSSLPGEEDPRGKRSSLPCERTGLHLDRQAGGECAPPRRLRAIVPAQKAA